MPITGQPILAARSITLTIFSPITSPSEPPKTVKSCEKTHTGRPSIRPWPVTTASPQGRFFCMSNSCVRWRTKVSSSWNAARVEQLLDPLARGQLALARAASPPPRGSVWIACSRSSWSWASFSSYVSAAFWRKGGGRYPRRRRPSGARERAVVRRAEGVERAVEHRADARVGVERGVGPGSAGSASAAGSGSAADHRLGLDGGRRVPGSVEDRLERHRVPLPDGCGRLGLARALRAGSGRLRPAHAEQPGEQARAARAIAAARSDRSARIRTRGSAARAPARAPVRAQRPRLELPGSAGGWRLAGSGSGSGARARAPAPRPSAPPSCPSPRTRSARCRS